MMDSIQPAESLHLLPSLPLSPRPAPCKPAVCIESPSATRRTCDDGTIAKNTNTASARSRGLTARTVEHLTFIAVRFATISLTKTNDGNSSQTVIRNCLFSNWDDAKSLLLQAKSDAIADPNVDPPEYEVFDDIHEAMRYLFGRNFFIENSNMTTISESTSSNSNSDLSKTTSNHVLTTSTVSREKHYNVDMTSNNEGSSGIGDTVNVNGSTCNSNTSLVDSIVEDILPNNNNHDDEVASTAVSHIEPPQPFLPDVKEYLSTNHTTASPADNADTNTSINNIKRNHNKNSNDIIDDSISNNVQQPSGMSMNMYAEVDHHNNDNDMEQFYDNTSNNVAEIETSQSAQLNICTEHTDSHIAGAERISELKQHQQQSSLTLSQHNHETTPNTNNHPNKNDSSTSTTAKNRQRRIPKHQTKAGQKFTKNWEEQYSKLCQYGINTPIPPHNVSLIRWIQKQKKEYRELQSSGESKLSPSQLQKLMDIGFQFTSRKQYRSWEDRMEEFRIYRQNVGHGRVPVSHPTLGSWVHEQRRQYKLYLRNDPKTKLTEEKLHELKESGFVFEMAKKRQSVDARSNAKSWEERFEELKLFKSKYGHTIVPQHYPKLGWWVNTQRKVRKARQACMNEGMRQ